MEMMRKLAIVGLVIAVLFGRFGEGLKGQTLCNLPVAGQIACKPSVTPPRPPKPTNGCCSALAKADFACLCSYKSLMPSFGIDPKLVMQLPAKCKLPPPAKC